jgi:hypothetical protein
MKIWTVFYLMPLPSHLGIQPQSCKAVVQGETLKDAVDEFFAGKGSVLDDATAAESRRLLAKVVAVCSGNVYDHLIDLNVDEVMMFQEFQDPEIQRVMCTITDVPEEDEK